MNNNIRYHSEDLNKQIYLLNPVVTKNSRGTTVYTYPDPATDIIPPTRAYIEPFSSMIVKGQALQVDTVLYRIVIRYREGVNPEVRVMYQGRVFEQVVPPLDIYMRHQYLQLTCKELLANG